VVALSDPLLLVCYRQSSEELIASVWTWGNVEDASEYVRDFKSQQRKRHICEAIALFGKVGHVWTQVGVVDIERLHCVSGNG
jgi:hypothetical protein